MISRRCDSIYYRQLCNPHLLNCQRSLWTPPEDEEDKLEAEVTKAKKVVDIDKRIRGTWMTLEASKRERRVVAATTHQFTRS